MKRLTCGLLLFTGALLIPSAVHAQSTGAIAGVVRDTSGGVLPGVTVEASSPSLIEGVRASITAGSGNYQILQLPAGTYSVTFTLPGFSTVVREGVELTTAFTANINADMPVGGVEETITVTGASPVVDIQSTRGQATLQLDTIEALPVGRTRRGIAELTLGAVSASRGAAIIDQGGSKGDGTQRLEIHGMRGNEQRLTYDGMNNNNLNSGGSGQNWMMNQMSLQEAVMGTSTASAEQETSGMSVNYVPREGSNQFSFSFVGGGSVEDLQADNLSPEILATGVVSVQKVKSIFDWGVGGGGALVRDRAWIYTSFRWWGAQEYQPDAHFNKSTNPFAYERDLSRRAFQFPESLDGGARLTWQAAEKHKVNFDFHLQNSCQCFLVLTSTRPPETSPDVETWPGMQTIGTWNFIPSNNLLFEAGASFFYVPYDLTRGATRFDDMIWTQERTTGIIVGGNSLVCCSAGDGEDIEQNNFNERFSVSYLTGAHTIKVGQQWLEGYYNYDQRINRNLQYFLRNGVPESLTQWASPINWTDRHRMIALYAQDQWTLDRLTLNLGARYDHFEGWIPAGTRADTQFVPGFSFDRVNDVPNYNDFSPRIGAAYDVFGDGKTAIKGSFGKYVGGLGNELQTPNNPELAIARSTSRSFIDANADFVADCNLSNLAANGECGAVANTAFGQPVQNVFYSPSLLEGWNQRIYTWQSNIQVQQELFPGVGLNVGYFFTSYRNFSVTQNTLVAASDFDTYCITAPSDARLPGGGGNEICGLFDINPASFGQSRTLVTDAEQFGNQLERYDGVDAQVIARLPRGGLLQGGVSIGRKKLNNCYQNARPDFTSAGTRAGTSRTSAFCDVTPPWSAGTQIKVAGFFPLQWGGLEPSFTFQSLPGRDLLATATIPNAAIVPSLGRDLAAGARRSVRVGVIPPATVFLDRINALDLALAKRLSIGGYRLKGTVELYNVFNEATVLNVNSSFGSSWQRPSSIIGGRLLTFKAQLDF